MRGGGAHLVTPGHTSASPACLPAAEGGAGVGRVVRALLLPLFQEVGESGTLHCRGALPPFVSHFCVTLLPVSLLCDFCVTLPPVSLLCDFCVTLLPASLLFDFCDPAACLTSV